MLRALIRINTILCLLVFFNSMLSFAQEESAQEESAQVESAQEESAQDKLSQDDPVGTGEAMSDTNQMEDEKNEKIKEEKAEKEQLATWVTSDGGVFNPYKLHIGAAKFKFDEDELSGYHDFYGEEGISPMIGVEWYFMKWSYFSFGLMFRGGYYVDTGFASSAGDTYERAEDSQISFTIIPLHAGASMQLTPFSFKWLVVEGWTGIERAYVQEARETAADSTADSSNSDSAAAKSLVNTEWTNQIFVGGALHFLLNGIDEKTALSAKSMGITRIYLSPFFETYRSVSNSSSFKLDRIAYGINFSFETRGI